jgi:hypothetical protein
MPRILARWVAWHNTYFGVVLGSVRDGDPISKSVGYGIIISFVPCII